MKTIHVKIDGKDLVFFECTGYFRSIGETEEDRRDLLYLAEECDNEEIYESLFSDNLIDGEEYTWDDIIPGSTYKDDLDTIEIDGEILNNIISKCGYYYLLYNFSE